MFVNEKRFVNPFPPPPLLPALSIDPYLPYDFDDQADLVDMADLGVSGTGSLVNDEPVVGPDIGADTGARCTRSREALTSIRNDGFDFGRESIPIPIPWTPPPLPVPFAALIPPATLASSCFLSSSRRFFSSLSRSARSLSSFCLCFSLILSFSFSALSLIFSNSRSIFSFSFSFSRSLSFSFSLSLLDTLGPLDPDPSGISGTCLARSLLKKKSFFSDFCFRTTFSAPTGRGGGASVEETLGRKTEVSDIERLFRERRNDKGGTCWGLSRDSRELGDSRVEVRSSGAVGKGGVGGRVVEVETVGCDGRSLSGGAGTVGNVVARIGGLTTGGEDDPSRDVDVDADADADADGGETWPMAFCNGSGKFGGVNEMGDSVYMSSSPTLVSSKEDRGVTNTSFSVSSSEVDIESCRF